MEIKKWVVEHLWEDSYFTPAKLGIKHNLYSANYKWPMITSLIEGYGTPAKWKRSNERGLTESFFENIKPLVSRYKASWFYITDPDNALSVFEWEKEIESKFFNYYELEELHLHPAEQGGVSYLGILLHSYDGMFIFELSDPFEINFYGTEEKWQDLKKLLDI